MAHFARALTLLLGGGAALVRCSIVLTERATGTSNPCSTTAFSVPNSDFETGSLGPWVPSLGSGDATVSIVSPGNGSTYAVELQVAGSTAGIQQQHIPLCPGWEYLISVDYKVSATNATCHLHFAAEHGNYSVPKNILPDIEVTDWTTTFWYYRDVSSDAFVLGAQLRCVETANTAATVLLDNWTIEQTRQINQSNCPLPIPVPNGDFETGALAPFTASGYGGSTKGTGFVTSVTSPGYKSNYGLQVDVTPDATEPIEWGIDLFPFVTACINDNNTISFAVNWLDYAGPLNLTNTSEYNVQGCILVVNIVDCIFGSGHSDVAFLPVSAKPGWQVHEFSCIRKEHSSDFDITLRCNPDPKGETVIPPFTILFDDISVAAVKS